MNRSILVAGSCLALLVATARADDPALDGLRSRDVNGRRASANLVRLGSRDLQLRALPILIDLLSTEKDGQVRLAVLDALTALGPAAEPAIPALIQTLRSNYGGQGQEESHQDYRSALALAAIGRPAVEGLRGLLKERKESVRAEVVMALGRVGPDAAAAIADLIPLLGDPSSRIRREASRALGLIGPEAIEPLVAASSRSDLFTREAAAEALGFLHKPDDRACRAALDLAGDPSPEVRAAALRSLARLELADDRLVSVVVANLTLDDDRVRRAVVALLLERASLRARLAPELESLLTAESEEVARSAAFLLGKSGESSVPRLLAALRRDGSRVEPIADGLAQGGRLAVAGLTRALDDPEPRVRRASALALAQIRPLATATIGRLAAGLADPDTEVRASFLGALGQLGPRALGSAPAVRGLLHDASPEIRGRAIEVLVQTSPRDDRLVGDLTILLEDPEAPVQRRAIDALRALGPAGRPTLGVVIRLLASRDPGVRLASVQMVESQGTDALDAIPALVPLLEDPNPKIRTLAATSLGRLGKPAQPAFAPLTKLLGDADVAVREAAASALGGLEVDAQTLRPHLARAFLDDKVEVRRAASRAIPRLGPEGVLLVPDIILMAARKENQRSVDRLLRPFERTGPDPRSLPELVQYLDHDQTAVRLLAIKFLGLAGPRASAALPALERIANDPRSEVHQQARAAADKIKNDKPTGSGDR